MNYELCKKLKDAGFPLKKRCLCESNCIHLNFPTLSEMIGACGDKFESLVFHKEEFKAYPIKNISDEIYQDGDVPNKGWCKTPEEAVANLWLELNKKFSS